jgi:exodeoxyribonuclease VII large subunit
VNEPLRPQPAPAPWGVSALLLAVADHLAARFGALAVRGEISGFTRAASGHCYFSLKDSDGGNGSVRCVMFRRAAMLLDVAPADGQQVELRGRIGVYEPRGELQVIAESLQRIGSGTLYEEFLRLRARLAAQGLFDAARKRLIAPQPLRVGVVTSLAAAALRDVVTALRRRSPQTAVVIYPCQVQGAEAPATIVAALTAAAARREVDTLLLVRGGGSLEDLWAFNDERVVRAVAASPIPVVCGVGHETDVTLADLAADLRAATPTAAAELAAPERQGQIDALAAQHRRMRRALHRVLERESQRLDIVVHRAGRPASTLVAQRHRAEALAQRLRAALGQRCRAAAQWQAFAAQRLRQARLAREQSSRQRLEALAARLTAAHPAQVLQRGFAWLQDAHGSPVTRVASLRVGDAVTAVLSDGRAQARIEAVEPDRRAEPGPGRMPPP